MVVGAAVLLSLLVSLIPQKEPASGERIRGVVVGPLGEPVPAAEVWATRLSMGESQARARADGEGRFLIQVPQASWWWIHATSERRAVVSKFVRDADEHLEIVLVDAATITGTVRDRAGKV